MAGETKYKVWGYWAKKPLSLHSERKCIGSTDTLEEALQLKNDAEKVGWPTVCIFENDHVVEPTV